MIPASASPPDRAWWLARLHPATRLGALPLALATCLLAPPWLLPALLAGLALALRRGGLPWRAQLATARAWWTVALLVVALHAFTTVAAAPLGHPSWTGLGRGLTAVGRAAATIACLGLLLRALPLADLIAALAWWGLAGMRRGPGPARLGVALAVALGAAPSVAAEGRRILAVARLRRGGAMPVGRPRRWWARVLDAGQLALPLLESLFRRAEALTISLRWRVPRPALLTRPPWLQIGALAGWIVLLVALVVGRRGGP